MFTGLIQHVGEIEALDRGPDAARLRVNARGWTHQAEPGESIAINGCCLSVVSSEQALVFDVVPETLQATTLGVLAQGTRVNLEHAATPTTLLGGHLVQGHVDFIGTVLANGNDGAEGWKLRIDPPAAMRRYLVHKGSVTIDGVSLTIASCEEGVLEAALIPETLTRTTLGELAEADQVNLEADCLLKMVDRLLGEHGLPERHLESDDS